MRKTENQIAAYTQSSLETSHTDIHRILSMVKEERKDEAKLLLKTTIQNLVEVLSWL